MKANQNAELESKLMQASDTIYQMGMIFFRLKYKNHVEVDQ